MGIISAARGQDAAGIEGEADKVTDGSGAGGKKLGRVPGLGGKADTSKPEL